MKCGSLPSVPNTNVTSNLTGEYQESVAYECKEGYRSIEGTTVRECQDDKQWSGSALVCEEITCGVPTSVENATYTVMDTTLYSIAE